MIDGVILMPAVEKIVEERKEVKGCCYHATASTNLFTARHGVCNRDELDAD